MAERERTTAGSSPPAATPQQVGEIEVRRSKRRRRTVSAYRDGDRVVVLLPARMSRAEERRWVGVMVDRIHAQEARRRPSDQQLLERAERLSRRYLDGRAVPSSVRWVGNQATRWGSCTPSDRTIRLSTRLQGMPSWVVDYVLLHELAHLLEPGHTPRFWELLAAYSRTERARGYLEGVSAAAALGMEPCADQQDGEVRPGDEDVPGEPPLPDADVLPVDPVAAAEADTDAVQMIEPARGDRGDRAVADHSDTGWSEESDERLTGQSDG